MFGKITIFAAVKVRLLKIHPCLYRGSRYLICLRRSRTDYFINKSRNEETIYYIN